jgi:response regulator NasT
VFVSDDVMARHMVTRSIVLEQSVNGESGLCAVLRDAGMLVVRTLESLETLLPVVRTTRPDVVIVKQSSANAELIRAMMTLSQDFPIPVIVILQTVDSMTIERIIGAGASSLLADGFEVSRLPSIIQVAVTRFRQQRVLIDELEKTKKSLSDRKVIERAKGLLMEQGCRSEDEAYKALRRTAMNANLRLVDVASQIVALKKLS